MTKKLSGLAKRRVLIIDSDMDFLTFLSTILEGQGYMVFCALDVPYALRLFAAVEPDVVVIDADMDDTDPLDLCESLVSGPLTPAVLIVSDTPPNDADMLLAQQAGVFGIIDRPFEIDVLLDTVAQALAARPEEPLM